jgi:hypothetical protein
MGKTQDKHRLDLVKAFSDDTNQRKIDMPNEIIDITTPNNLSVKPMSIMRRSYSFPIRIRRHSSPIRNKSIKRSHSSPIRNRSIKRSRNSSIQRRRIRSRTSQKKSIS